jgi:exonuclease V
VQDELLRKPEPQHARRVGDLNPTVTEGNKHVLPTYPLPHNVLSVVDTKTRHSNSIPAHADTLPSRLQLMLYHRLLSPLVSSSNLIDFSALWARLKLDPSKSFSFAFTTQARLAWDSPQVTSPSCLNDLTSIWRDAVQQLDITGVDRTLQLVYRDRKTVKRKDPRKTTLGGMVVEGSQKEASDFAKAVEASLRDIVGGGGASEDEQLAKAIAASLQESEASEDTSSSVTTMSVDRQVESSGSSRQRVGECEPALVQADPLKEDVDSPGGKFTLC